MADPSALLSASEADTVAAGRRLGAALAAGTVVLLEGELGAGKTAFVRGLAEGLGADSGDVSSPTFTLIQEYAGRVTLHHADLYRLTPDEVDDLGLEELPGPDGVLAVEWPDRWRRPPAEAVRVRLEHAGEGARRITIPSAPPSAAPSAPGSRR